MYVPTPHDAEQYGERAVISVVVPSKNKRGYLSRCLDSLLGSINTFGPAELVVVDNGSEDGSYELAKEHRSDRCRVVQVLGGTISRVRNAGAAEAAGDVLCFIDADCVVQPDYLSQVERVLEETGAAAVGCKVGLPENPTWVETLWHRLHVHESDGYRSWMNSANFAIRRTAFLEIGGFAEHLVTGEDTEICQRLIAAGGRIYEDQRLRVQHLDNAKTVIAFFKKEHWRALGMFGTVSRKAIDRPLAATLAHLAAIASAVVIALVPTIPAAGAAIATLVLFLTVPTISVVYRQRQFRHSLLSVRAVALYAVYLTARCAALATLTWSRIKQSASSR